MLFARSSLLQSAEFRVSEHWCKGQAQTLSGVKLCCLVHLSTCSHLCSCCRNLPSRLCYLSERSTSTTRVFQSCGNQKIWREKQQLSESSGQVLVYSWVMQQTVCCWKAMIDQCLSRWHRKVSGKVVLPRYQAWLFVQNRYSPSLSILFEAPGCSSQAVVGSAATDHHWRLLVPLTGDNMIVSLLWRVLHMRCANLSGISITAFVMHSRIHLVFMTSPAGHSP